MNEALRQQVLTLHKKLEKTDLPPAEEQQILEEIRPCIKSLRRRNTPGAFSRHISNAVEEAFRERNLRDGPRLCGCHDMMCPLKRGSVPPELQYRAFRHFSTPSRRAAATRFLEKHPQAWVIRDAVDEWDDEEADAEATIRNAIARVDSLYEGRVEVP